MRAGDLNGDQQGAEREDHERKRCRGEGLEQSLRAGHAKAQEGPSKPVVKPVQQSCDKEFKRYGDKWNNPKRRLEIAPQTVELIPSHLAILFGLVAPQFASFRPNGSNMLI